MPFDSTTPCIRTLIVLYINMYFVRGCVFVCANTGMQQCMNCIVFGWNAFRICRYVCCSFWNVNCCVFCSVRLQFLVLVNFICCIWSPIQTLHELDCSALYYGLTRCRISNKYNNRNSFKVFAYKYNMQINNIIAFSFSEGVRCVCDEAA